METGKGSIDVVGEIRRIDEEQAEEEQRNPLAGYSTRQLKAELERRRSRRPIPTLFGTGLTHW